MYSSEKSFLNRMQHLFLEHKADAFVMVYAILTLFLSSCGCNAPLECEDITTNSGADVADKWSLVRTMKTCIADCSTSMFSHSTSGGTKVRYWLLDHSKLEITEITSTIKPLEGEGTLWMDNWKNKYFELLVSSSVDRIPGTRDLSVTSNSYFYDPATKKLDPELHTYVFIVDTLLGTPRYGAWKEPDTWLLSFWQSYDGSSWPVDSVERDLGDHFTAYYVMRQKGASFETEPVYPNEIFKTKHSLWYFLEYKDGMMLGGAWTSLDSMTVFTENKGVIDSVIMKLPWKKNIGPRVQIKHMNQCLEFEITYMTPRYYYVSLDLNPLAVSEPQPVGIVDGGYPFPEMCGEYPVSDEMFWTKTDSSFVLSNYTTHKEFIYPPLEEW